MGICAAAMTVTSLPYTAMKVSAEPEAAVQQTTGNDLKLWYTSPADITKYYEGWQENSLPIGNGGIGGTVFGGITTERIQLNDKSLWSGGPSDSRKNYNGGNLEDKGNRGNTMKSIQEYFANGRDTAATDLAKSSLIGASDDAGINGYGYYLSWGNMYIDFKNVSSNSDVSNYSRDLDLNTAIAGVNYDKGSTHYSRENFTSYPDNVIVTHITADGSEKISLDVSIEPDNTSGGAANSIGENSYKRTWDTTVLGGRIFINGQLTDNQMKFSSQTQVITDNAGTVTDGDGKVSVSGASEVTIITSMGTDYKDEYPSYRTGETESELTNRVKWYVDQAAVKTYEELKANHVSDYQKIFNRVDLDLGQTVSTKTTDALLSAYKAGTASEAERRQLEVMLFQYGRFMTIESSRETRTDGNGYVRETLPSNLQGLWVGANNSPWHSDYHMNVNLQMNYWPTYSTNMAECGQPLIDYIDALREPGRVTAAIYAGVVSENGQENGFMAHTQNNPFGWTCPGWEFSWGWSPAAVPWILQNCWDYYEYTGDTSYLKNNIYPMMKEEAKLYDKMLVEQNGKLVSSPAFSPEHGPVTNGNTYEQSLIWQLYEDTIKAAEVLGTDAELVATWKANQADLKGPIEVGDSGQIKEWYTETTVNSMGSGYGHRHISHLLGLYPGDLITEDKKDWFAAARVSMQNRTDESTGWGMAQRINSWARLGDGNKAYQLIKNLFKGGIYANLFDYHENMSDKNGPHYFQIDGNFGYTSGVAEMLLQSNAGYINLLPAVPDDWAKGSVDGLVAQGNFEVSMNWSNKVLRTTTIKSNKGGEVIVQAENIALGTVTDSNGKVVDFEKVKDHGNNRISFTTTKDETYTISDVPNSRDIEVPTGLTALRKDTNKVVVSWNAISAEGKAVTYNVYRKAGNGSFECIASGLTETTYVDTDEETSLGVMEYQITAVINGIESEKCDAVAETEAGKVLMQVKPSVLQENAISNSQQNPPQGNDSLASWAFDDDEHWWHSRWTGDKPESEDLIDKQGTVRPWIGSGFDQEIMLKKVTYEGRADKANKPNVNNSIRKYSLYYADTSKTTPDSSDWILAKRGHFQNIAGEQEIVLDQAVKATHFKLVGENTNNWQNGDTAWTGNGRGGDGSTCAQNIKVYAEDTLNFTVTAPVDGRTLTDVKNEAVEETVATVKDTSENPIDTSEAIMNNDGTFGGQIAGVDDSKLDVLTGQTPFMIRMKVRLNSEPTTNHILINRGDKPYQIAYGKDNTVPKIKFQMCDTSGTWHETKVCVTGKIGQEIDILALYTGTTMGLWVDGGRCDDYSNQGHNTNPNSSYTMKTGTVNA
ncbi:glycosyl hydrolase family 95 catalytic domain-containing protein, partial [[Ruminococcus] lactaris]